ncbi:hypothetical protein ACFSUK_33660 [Sphingobium scionense]
MGDADLNIGRAGARRRRFKPGAAFSLGGARRLLKTARRAIEMPGACAGDIDDHTGLRAGAADTLRRGRAHFGRIEFDRQRGRLGARLAVWASALPARNRVAKDASASEARPMKSVSGEPAVTARRRNWREPVRGFGKRVSGR